MKMNKLKKAPAPRTVEDEIGDDTISPLLGSESLLLEDVDAIKAKLVEYDDNKKELLLISRPYFVFQKIGGFRVEKLKNCAVQLKFYNNNSLYGNIIEYKFIARLHDDNSLALTVKLKRNEKDTDDNVKRAINGQINSQDEIGESANVNLNLLPSTYSAKPPRIALKKIEDVDSANDFDDWVGPDRITISEVNEALKGSGYTAVVAEEGIGEIIASHARFEGCLIRANVNTEGELVVIMRQPRQSRQAVNIVYNAAANRLTTVIDNVADVTGMKRFRQLADSRRRIAFTNTIVKNNTVSHESFADVANFVKESWSWSLGDGDDFDVQIAAATKKTRSDYVRIKMSGLEVARGEITSLNYDEDISALQFRTTILRTSGWLNGMMFIGDVDFEVLQEK